MKEPTTNEIKYLPTYPGSRKTIIRQCPSCHCSFETFERVPNTFCGVECRAGDQRTEWLLGDGSIAEQLDPHDFVGLLHGVVAKRTKIRPIKDTEEYSNAWIGLLEACSNYRNQMPVRKFVIRAMDYRIRSSQRYRQRRPTTNLTEVRAMLTRCHRTPLPGEIAIKNEAKQGLRDASKEIDRTTLERIVDGAPSESDEAVIRQLRRQLASFAPTPDELRYRRTRPWVRTRCGRGRIEGSRNWEMHFHREAAYQAGLRAGKWENPNQAGGKDGLPRTASLRQSLKLAAVRRAEQAKGEAALAEGGDDE